MRTPQRALWFDVLALATSVRPQKGSGASRILMESKVSDAT